MRQIIFFFLLIFLFGCSPRVMVTGEWTNEDIRDTSDYNKIMITALVANEGTKRALEDAFTTELSRVGVQSSRSYEIFPTMFSSKDNNREAMLEKIRQTDNDAILTVSILDEDTETRYVPGNVQTYRPLNTYGWYGSFRGYYDYYYPRIYEPGYYTTTKVYFIEVNLYDTNSGRLMWSLQTETYDPARLESIAGDIAETVVKEMPE